MLPTNVDTAARGWANDRLLQIEARFDADLLTMIGPIGYGLENLVRAVVEPLQDKRETLLVIVDTVGGVVEVVERIVTVFRTHYPEVCYLIPDRAMSAGTVLVMSGDAIYMDYHSCLGPIDPQVEREGKLVPALSYLHQYDRLMKKAEKGTLSTAEVVLLQKLDLAELHQFELARDLSISLLKEWLASYKFKDWEVTETRQLPVTQEMRKQRAAEIAGELSKHQYWGTHSRPISMSTLQSKLKLRIDDYRTDAETGSLVWDYFWFLRDHMNRHNLTSFVHTRTFF